MDRGRLEKRPKVCIGGCGQLGVDASSVVIACDLGSLTERLCWRGKSVSPTTRSNDVRTKLIYLRLKLLDVVITTH